MQINIKQAEIEAAIKGYIASQGIKVHGKQVTISFTAGRKESGLTAEIIIEGNDQEVKPITGSVLRAVEQSEVRPTQPEEVAQAEKEDHAPVSAQTESLFGV